jgi:hypothetical protein
MKTYKNKKTSLLVAVLLGLLVLAYKTMFMSSGEDLQGLTIEENVLASERVQIILQKVDGISFDKSIFEDEKFNSLKSIETPLISLPVGRKNPFSAVFGFD